VLVEECAAVPKPPPPAYSEVDGRTVDTTITPELTALCRRGCEILCGALLKPAQWTMGRTKVFLKDMALDQIVALFRTYHAMRIKSWWRMAKQRRLYVRFKKAVNACKKVRAAGTVGRGRRSVDVVVACAGVQGDPAAPQVRGRVASDHAPAGARAATGSRQAVPAHPEDTRQRGGQGAGDLPHVPRPQKVRSRTRHVARAVSHAPTRTLTRSQVQAHPGGVVQDAGQLPGPTGAQGVLALSCCGCEAAGFQSHGGGEGPLPPQEESGACT